MTNYQLGKIYKIVCNTTGLTYYGSTCEPTLARRLANHKTTYKFWKSGKKIGNVKSFEVMGNDDYVIALVEPFPCDNKMELQQRERYYIENNDCVNKNIPTRTSAEYQIEHKERFAVLHAENYQNNRGVRLEQSAEYYKKNRDKFIKKQAI